MAMVSGKVTLVTGAAAGIGRATAQIFADDGTKVMVSDIDQMDGERNRIANQGYWRRRHVRQGRYLQTRKRRKND